MKFQYMTSKAFLISILSSIFLLKIFYGDDSDNKDKGSVSDVGIGGK